MKKRLIFLLLLFVLLLSACNGNDELSGKTYAVSSSSGPDNPGKYNTIMTVEFFDGKVVTNAIHDGEGTYELNEDILDLYFETDNETVSLSFEIKESDKDFSDYSVRISDVDFEMTDTDEISHLQNLVAKFHKNTIYEFIKN